MFAELSSPGKGKVARKLSEGKQVSGSPGQRHHYSKQQDRAQWSSCFEASCKSINSRNIIHYLPGKGLAARGTTGDNKLLGTVQAAIKQEMRVWSCLIAFGKGNITRVPITATFPSPGLSHPRLRAGQTIQIKEGVSGGKERRESP